MAKEAIGRAVRDLGQSLVQAVNPRDLVDQHPLMSLGAAVAVGFVTTSAVTPSRGESFKHRVASLFPESREGAPAATAGKPSKLAGLITPMIDTVKMALVSTIGSAITAQAHQKWQQPPERVGGNGHAAHRESDTEAGPIKPF